ncbi:MAG: COG1470 family protein [Leucobacter sp.]
MRIRGVIAAVALALLGTGTPAQATTPSTQTQQNSGPWSVQIVESEATLGPFVAVETFSGVRDTITVEVENTSANVISLSISSIAVSAPQGMLEYREADSLLDPSNWVSRVEADGPVEVQAGASGSIPLAISVPNTAHDGDYPLGLVVTDAISGRSLHLPLLLRIPGDDRNTQLEATSTLSLDGVNTWPLTPIRSESRYELRNTGTTVVSGALEIDVTTLFSHSSQAAVLEDVVVLPGDTLSGTSLDEVQVIGVAAPSLRFVADGWENAGEDPAGGWEQRFVGDTTPAIPLMALVTLAIVVLGAGATWTFIKRRANHHAQHASDA